jgi:hypothetical protein
VDREQCHAVPADSKEHAVVIFNQEIRMQNEHENPQSPRHGQQGNPQTTDRPGQERQMPPGQEPRNPNERQRDDEQGRRHGQTGGDQGKVGQDTDGDGKVVKPGQKPGQSGGKGLPETK